MRFSLLLILAVCLGAQAPKTDSRNTDIPGTDTHFRSREYSSLEEWKAQKQRLQQQILFAAGLLPEPERTPLRPQVFGHLEREGYSIDKVLLETLPGYYLGGNLYRPTGSGPFPAIIKPHGHWIYGRLEHQPLNSTQTLAVNLARMGFIVFTYDMVGYNDTVQTPHRFGGREEQLWNFGPLGLQLWNSIRVVDFVEALPDVDPLRIGATGASGGATQVFLLSAVDDRIAVSAPVNMVSAIMQGGCVCENAPGLRVRTFNVEIAAMAAPRPQLLVAATGDWTKNVPREEFPAVQRIYELYGESDSAEAVQFDAPHNYNQQSRIAVYRFLTRHLLGSQETGSVEEIEVSIERPDDLLALYGRPLPKKALDYEGLLTEWKKRARDRIKAVREPARLQHALALALKVEWPDEPSHELQGIRIVLSRRGVGDRVPGLWLPGKGEPALIVHQDGALAGRNTREAKKRIEAGRPVLLIDAFQTGTAVAPRDRSHEHFLTFNLSDDAARVQDVLTALAFLSERHEGRIELVASGPAAVWSQFAAALAPVALRLEADLGGFRGTDDDFLRSFFVPGIQLAGGLRTARKLTRSKR